MCINIKENLNYKLKFLNDSEDLEGDVEYIKVFFDDVSNIKEITYYIFFFKDKAAIKNIFEILKNYLLIYLKQYLLHEERQQSCFNVNLLKIKNLCLKMATFLILL